MIINSLLDTDSYTFSVGRAVLERFPNTHVTFSFTNRNPEMKFSSECYNAIIDEIRHLRNLSFSDDEIEWMRLNSTFSSETYLCWLKNLRLNPNKEINAYLDNGELRLVISGDWARVLFYEVPVLAIISECYFKYMNTDWSYAGQDDQHRRKGRQLSHLSFADFGTRRRRSFESQDRVVKNMKDYAGFSGTSNVLLAKKHNVRAIGTQSHQWIMGVSALCGLRHANRFAMEEWIKTFDGNLAIALTDTFGSEAFFKDFNLEYSKIFDGVRHDSGNALDFVDKTIAHYKSIGLDPKSKIIVFSDGLTPESAENIADYCKDKIKCSFGIGTNFSNDYMNKGAVSKPLSIVIKLRTCNGIPVVKLSDNPEKATGDHDAICVAKWTFFGTCLNESVRNS